MVAEVDVSVRGLNELIRKVSGNGLQKGLRRKVADSVGASLLDRQRRRFLEATDPDGNAWPVSFAALRRSASGIGGKTLFDSGTLFRSIQYGLLSDTTGVIGTDVPYASDHQFGQNGNPVRTFLGFTEADAEIAGIIAAKIIEDNI